MLLVAFLRLFAFLFHESPRYLLACGHDNDAVAAIAVRGHRPRISTLQHFPTPSVTVHLSVIFHSHQLSAYLTAERISTTQ
jgi:hypothetical protein